MKYDATAGAPLEGWRVDGGRSMVRERSLCVGGGGGE